jgi:hypothetical protein
MEYGVRSTGGMEGNGEYNSAEDIYEAIKESREENTAA